MLLQGDMGEMGFTCMAVSVPFLKVVLAEQGKKALKKKRMHRPEELGPD